MKYITLSIFLATIFISGCGLGPSRPEIEPNKYTSLVCVVAGHAAVTDGDGIDPYNPNPDPNPTPSVVPTKDCNTCYQKGWLGDGRPRADCPDCDYDGDGDPNEPLSIFLSQGEKTEPEQKKGSEPESNPKPKSEKTVDEVIVPLWVNSTGRAKELAKTNNKQIVVLFADNKNLFDNHVLQEFMRKHFVCVLNNNADSYQDWTKVAEDSPLIKNQKFVNNAFCVLDAGGNFQRSATEVFHNAEQEPLQILENLESYLPEL